MRHRVYGRRLNRNGAHRRAMRRNMAAGFFEHGQIVTTLPKAKAVQPFVEKLITLAKRGDLHSRRRAVTILRDRIMCDDPDQVTRDRYGEVRKGPKLIKHLFEEVAPKFADRAGGYTRIVRLSKNRLGDGSALVALQLVGEESGPEIGGQPSRRRTTKARRRAFAEKALAAAGSSSPGDEAAAE